LELNPVSGAQYNEGGMKLVWGWMSLLYYPGATLFSCLSPTTDSLKQVVQWAKLQFFLVVMIGSGWLSVNSQSRSAYLSAEPWLSECYVIEIQADFNSITHFPSHQLHRLPAHTLPAT
jgi:hypothetical protein